ncbi:unnamed protein product [Closterium sp. NIES-54]
MLPARCACCPHAARTLLALPARRPCCPVPPALPARCRPAVSCPVRCIARAALRCLRAPCLSRPRITLCCPLTACCAASTTAAAASHRLCCPALPGCRWHCPARCPILLSCCCCLLMLSLMPATAATAAGHRHCYSACTRCRRCPAMPRRRQHCLACYPALPCTLPSAALHAAQRCPALLGRRQHCLARCAALPYPAWPHPALSCTLPSATLPCLAAASTALHAAQHCQAAAAVCFCRHCCQPLPLLLPAAATAAPALTFAATLPPLLLTAAARHGPYYCFSEMESPEHTSGSLEVPTTPTEPAADAGEAVHRQYRADCVVCAQWTERDAVVELAVRAHLPVDERTHFRLVASAHNFYDTIAKYYSSLSPATQPLRQRSPLLEEVQQLVEEASVGGAAGGRGGSGSGHPGGGAWGTSAGDAEAPGGVEAASLGACDSASTGAEPEEALHTFTLDLGASQCFSRNSTTITSLTAPIPVTLADPSDGPVVARSSTILPCPAAPSGLLVGLHLPSFAKNLVATSVLQDQWVTVTQPGGELVAICTDSCTGEQLATFTRRPGSGLYTLTTKSAQVAESGQVAASVEVAASCSSRLLTHQSLLWHHRLGHPSLPCLRGMHSRLLVSGLPRSLPPLPRSFALPCLPCVEERQRAAPHSSSFPPTTAPMQTLHMDVWGPARVIGHGGERYFLLVFDDYTCYTMVFPLQSKAEVHSVLIRWIRAVRLGLSARFRQYLPVLRLHSDRGGKFSSRLLEDFYGAEGIRQLFTLPASPQQNGIADCHIGLVIEVARTSMIHVATSHFLWPFAVDQPPLVEPLEFSSDTFGPMEGGDPKTDDTAATRRSPSLETLPGFLPRPSRPCSRSRWTLVLQEVATLGVLVLGTLSSQELRAWAVRWGSPGGGARGAGTGGAVTTRAGGSRGATNKQQLSALCHLLSLSLREPLVAGTTPPLLFPPPDQSQPYRERESCPVTPVRTRHVARPRSPPVPGTHIMVLRPSSVPERVVLPLPPTSSLPHVPDPESDRVRVVSPSVARFLATVVTDPSFESAAASALVAELVDFAALCRLDYVASLVSYSSCPPSVAGELALDCDVLEDRQFDLECLAATAPHLASTLLCPEGVPDALDIPNPRSYADAITGL